MGRQPPWGEFPIRVDFHVGYRPRNFGRRWKMRGHVGNPRGCALLPPALHNKKAMRLRDYRARGLFLNPFGGFLGSSWEPPGVSTGALGTFWGISGISWVSCASWSLWGSWKAPLRSLLGALWGSLRVSWDILGLLACPGSFLGLPMGLRGS